MFINEKSTQIINPNDATLPKATFCKIHGIDSPVFGLIGIYNSVKHLVPVEDKSFTIDEFSGDKYYIQFVKSPLNDEGFPFQSEDFLAFQNIKFGYDINSSDQFDSIKNIKFGSFVRTGTELQIIAKTSPTNSTKVAVTIKDGYTEDLGEKMVCFSSWNISYQDDSDWKIICKKTEDNVQVK